MATFKITIKKDKMRADKTWNVLIRFTHNRIVRYIPTTEYVSKKDLTVSYKIKNQKILDKCERLVLEYKKRISGLDLERNEVSIDTIISLLKEKDGSQNLSFTEYAKEWINKSKRKGNANYKTAINAFTRFCGHENILFSEITVNRIKEFEQSLIKKPRAMSLYTNAIVKIFRDARDFYNNEDEGIIRIKHSLDKYKAPQQNIAEKRALPIDVIRKIFSLPYITNHKGAQNRRNLALDCFRLSFCLMGMNSADLYNAESCCDGYIDYKRTKTRDRRLDHAAMHVKIHPVIRHLVEKYKGESRTFIFSERYADLKSFNRNINVGLKEVGKEIGVDGLQFYSARHSMATIAMNDVRIDKWTVNEMLCHTDPSMKVTDLYIKKDFTIINDANFKLLDYVFYHNILSHSRENDV